MPLRVIPGNMGRMSVSHQCPDLLQALGMKMFRFSISWSRVLPTGSGAVCNPPSVSTPIGGMTQEPS